MSSILKALKKIESRKAETRLPTWPYRIDNRESMSRHTNRTWRRHKLLGLLILVCTAALVGKLYLINRPAPERVASGGDISEKSAPRDPSEDERAVHQPQIETAGETTAMSSPLSPKVSREALPRTTPDTFSDASIFKSVTETPQTAPVDNAGLTLQALVWSEQPEDRFVVINGSILREGESVNGSFISRIEQDYVTIRTTGNTWRLEHGN